MVAIVLDRIDSAPIINSNFDDQFLQWLWVLVDSLNENLTDLQNALTLFSATGYTAAQIATMDAASDLVDGVIIYDTTNNVYVGRENGALVQFTTAPYP